MFANDELKEKRDNLREIIAIFKVSQNSIKINKNENYHYLHHLFINKREFDILTVKIKNIILEQCSVLPKECQYVFSLSPLKI